MHTPLPVSSLGAGLGFFLPAPAPAVAGAGATAAEEVPSTPPSASAIMRFNDTIACEPCGKGVTTTFHFGSVHNF
jgi:hypothetical protein